MSLCINPHCPNPNHPGNDDNRFCQSCGSQLDLVGRYRVMRLQSDKTTFHKIYEAYEQDKPKIIKVLKENLNSDAKAVELFQQEAAKLRQLDHCNIFNEDGYFQYQTRNGLALHCIAMKKTDDSNQQGWFTNSQKTINVVVNKKTKQLSTTTLPPQPVKQPNRVALLALFSALLVSLGLLGVVALVTRSPRYASLSPDYGQAPKKKGKIDYFSYQEGKDSQGRTAEFNVAVLSVEYKWLLGSDFQIKFNDKIINIDQLRGYLEQERIQTIMENPTEIISVGTASCEGLPQIEERRSFERAKQIQLLVKKLFFHVPSVKEYRLLNLGQFQRGDCQPNQDLTAYQRSIIIIGVRKLSEDVALDEALRNRLEKKPFADFKLKDYSLGSEEKFKTIPSKL